MSRFLAAIAAVFATKKSSVTAFEKKETMSCVASDESAIDKVDKITGALVGFYCGDSLAMPVHWYYDLRQLRSDFGEIRKYEKPKKTFPGSIMNLSNTGGGGRGSDKGDVVGDVILHGKKKYWLRGGNYHYHHGMEAGENTLDALITRVLTKSLISTQSFDLNNFRSDYITFMTTPGSHNDTYASTSHRMFFKNLRDGKTPEDCPDNDGHNVDSIDSLMIVPPVAIAFMDSSEEERAEAIKQSIHVTRKSSAVLVYANLYASMLIDVIQGMSIKDAVQSCGMKMGMDIAAEVRRSRADPMVAWYITSSFPALLYYGYKYGDDPEEMLLASTNGGGENVARTSLLATLAGAQSGLSNIPTHLRDNLLLSSEVQGEAQEFVRIFVR